MISKRHVGAFILVAALGILGMASAGLAESQLARIADWVVSRKS